MALFGRKQKDNVVAGELTNFIAIDLGTANTLVSINDQGIVFNEPSILAYDSQTNELLAIGNDAYAMVGRGNRNLRTVRPMVKGVVADVDATTEFVRYIFDQIDFTDSWNNSVVLLACPSIITPLERETLTQIAKVLGAGAVFVRDEALMACYGFGIDIFEPVGRLIVDVGGGTTDIAVVTSGSISKSNSTRIAGDQLNRDIIKYVRENYGIKIGLQTAEQIKYNIGSVVEYEGEKGLKVRGRDIVSGVPREVTIIPAEIRQILLEDWKLIVREIKVVLESTEPELAGDIYNEGIILSGGGCLIRGTEIYTAEALGLPVTKSPTALTDVVEGAAKYQPVIMDLIDRGIFSDRR